MHDRIVHLASRLCSLVPRVRNAHSESKRLMMRRGVVALEQDLDTLVYKLYGLGAGEVKAVESSLSGAAQI